MAKTDILILDAESVASRRIPLEEAEITFSKQSVWHCQFCNKKMAHESTFMRHSCDQKQRAELAVTPLGVAAYGYYKDWMRLKKYSQPSLDAFKTSKTFKAFIKFAQLVIDANIAKPEKFISLMIEGDIAPVLWCRSNSYAIYLEWSDKLADPFDQLQSSVNYLIDICEKDDIELKNVFSKLGTQHILSLTRQRRLSPWLLFCSSSFCEMLKNMDSEQRASFNTVINAEYWSNRFKTESTTVSKIKHIVNEIGL